MLDILQSWENRAWRVFIPVIILFLLLSVAAAALPFIEREDPVNREIIRFHVQAHSNDPRDQGIKNKLAVYLVQLYAPLWNECQSVEQLYALLEQDREKIAQTAHRFLQERGFSDPVKVMFGSYFFPARLYGDRFYPPGEYTALRVIIGSGEGENWWCVLFPPLCFTVFRAQTGRDAEQDLPTQKVQANDRELREEGKPPSAEEESSNSGGWRFWIVDLFRR